MNIVFRPVEASDFALLRNWMEQPHWQEWWGDPDHELDQIRDMVEGKDASRPFLFSVDGKITGYIQYWFAGHHQNERWIEGYPWLAMLPKAAIGIDLSIGDETKLAKGIGSRVLAEFASRLNALGYEHIIIDPDADNRRAIRAYEKAGFGIIKELENNTGDTLLMAYETGNDRNLT